MQNEQKAIIARGVVAMLSAADYLEDESEMTPATAAELLEIRRHLHLLVAAAGHEWEEIMDACAEL